VRSWEANYARRAPEDLLAQLWTWQNGDISAHANFGGDLQRALKSIRAKVLLMPGDHDLYFRVEDNRRELPHLACAVLQPISSIWGHRAGNPFQAPDDAAFIENAVRALLED
jgi:homoserine O-acetyltransferase